MPINAKQKEVIKRCQSSPSFFLDNFAKIQHPKRGIIPFKLWSYQKKCLLEFRSNRLTIFKKTRQSGISTVTGGFALWYAMFSKQKRILIVSKRDLDAMDFLRKNIKTIHENLPDWMRALWPCVIDNEHEVGFPNGSRIMSLTSSKDTLRSHSSSLNIIDEAAFIDGMDEMWAAGAPSIMHGGRTIVISTVKGIGNWYWQTWTDADAGANDFKPIELNWWQMDWRMEFKDELGGKVHVIAPTDGIKACDTPQMKAKYGPYWSPWLEEQYRLLTEKGESSKFKQEILCTFLGTGDTVLEQEALEYAQACVQETGKKFSTVSIADYRNPNTEEAAKLDFQHRLWIWDLPNLGHPEDGQTLEEPPHTYILGADTATGDGRDSSAIEIFDLNTQEQVAEMQLKCLPRTFALMVDYLGRLYNNAFVVVERTGIGAGVCQDLATELLYENLYRRPKKNIFNKASKYGDVGWNTTHSSKPIMNKALIDNIAPEGIRIKSPRLYKELSIYVHLKGGKTGAEPGKGNNDDLVMATAMCLIGMNHAMAAGASTLMPVRAIEAKPELHDSSALYDRLRKISDQAGPGMVLPVFQTNEGVTGPMSIAQEINKFASQLGSRPLSMPATNPKRHVIRYRKNK